MPRSEIVHDGSTPDGDALALIREGDGFVVRVRRETLMSSRQHGSEAAMVAAAFEARAPGPGARVLVGGLGMGFTLRAALEALPARSEITVVELLPDVVTWNRGPLAHLAGRPLDDPRVRVETLDLVEFLARGGHAFDAILLDVDNGPEAFTVAANERLYREEGLLLMRRALGAGGALVVWSAFRSRAFERRLARAGLSPRVKTVRARPGGKGARHTLFVGVNARVPTPP